MEEITRRGALHGTLAAASGAVLAGASPARAASEERPTLTLLLVNDIYRMDEVDGRGGFARLAALVRAERARGVPLLYCHAGDCFSPSLMSGFDKGAHVVELLNLAPPDVFVPGNHEFDFGEEVYARRIAEANFPVFAANLRAADGTRLPRHEDARVFTLGGVRVGVLGLTLAASPRASRTGSLRFLPEMETLREGAAALRAQGVDLVVAVAHTGFERDVEIFRSRLVDVLLTGHDHDLRLVHDGRTVMAESGEEGRSLVAVDLFVTLSEAAGKRGVTWRPRFRILDSAEVTPDPAALAVIARLEGELSGQLDVPLARLAAPLDSRAGLVRGGEAAWGNLVADALREGTGAEVALVNGGGLRGNRVYPEGTRLTRRDVLGELPFGNTAVVLDLAGIDLADALENGVSRVEDRAGRFPHVSGLRFVLDPAAPRGSRVSRVEIGGEPLDLARRYRVASIDFLLRGGDGYDVLARGRPLVGLTDGDLLANLVMAHLRRLGEVNARVEGRIAAR